MRCFCVVQKQKGVAGAVIEAGQSLVCTEEVSPSDVILVENFDPHYFVFERAAALHKAGLAARVLVPTDASRDS